MAYASRGDDNHTSLGQRFRRMLVRSTSFAAAIQACLVLYALTAGQGSFGRLFFAAGITHSARGRIGYVLVAALMVFALVVQICCNRLDAWSTETEVDSFVRRRNSKFLLLLMIIGYALVVALTDKYGGAPPLNDLIAAALFFLILASEIVFGPNVFFATASAGVAREAVEDEFYRAMRTKASKVGFGVVMLAVSVALLLLHFHLTQEPAILFAVLYAGVAGSLLYYDFLIWRADRVH